MTVNQPIFIDIEASGLYHGSYPIEIAWGAQVDSIESHLINPASISSWANSWCKEAQALHGLSLEYITERGRDPYWVAERLNNALPLVVFSDNHAFDSVWVQELFHVCGPSIPDFYIESAQDLFLGLHQAQCERHGVQVEFDFNHIRRQALNHLGLCFIEHRAAPDVRLLITMKDIIEGRILPPANNR